MQEWLIPYLLVILMVSIFGYGLFNHFTRITVAQMDVTDMILNHFRSIQEEPELSDIDEGRTHVLGGFVHGDAICSDDCWCKEEE